LDDDDVAGANFVVLESLLRLDFVHLLGADLLVDLTPTTI